VRGTGGASRSKATRAFRRWVGRDRTRSVSQRARHQRRPVARAAPVGRPTGGGSLRALGPRWPAREGGPCAHQPQQPRDLRPTHLRRRSRGHRGDRPRSPPLKPCGRDSSSTTAAPVPVCLPRFVPLSDAHPPPWVAVPSRKVAASRSPLAESGYASDDRGARELAPPVPNQQSRRLKSGHSTPQRCWIYPKATAPPRTRGS
jgi:hypothetical protein